MNVLLACCLAYPYSATHQVPRSADPVGELEKRIVENRRKITHGEFVFDSDYHYHGSISEKKRISVFIKPGKSRVDLEAGNERTVGCFNGARHVLLRSGGQARADVTIQPLKPESEKVLRSQVWNRVINPQLVGVVPMDVYSLEQFSLSDVLERSDKVPGSAKVSKARIGESDLLRLNFTTKSNTSYALWVDETKGYNPVRVEWSWKDSTGILTKDTIQVTLKLDAGSQLWYPSTYSYWREEGGEKTATDQVTVVKAEINKDVADEKFELAGLEIPPGSHVEDLSRKTSIFGKWDGSAAVFPEKASKPASGASDKGGETLSRLLMAGGALLAICVGCWATWRAIRTGPV